MCFYKKINFHVYANVQHGEERLQGFMSVFSPIKYKKAISENVPQKKNLCLITNQSHINTFFRHNSMLRLKLKQQMSSGTQMCQVVKKWQMGKSQWDAVWHFSHFYSGCSLRCTHVFKIHTQQIDVQGDLFVVSRADFIRCLNSSHYFLLRKE